MGYINNEKKSDRAKDISLRRGSRILSVDRLFCTCEKTQRDK